jgi:hypothetical protein
MLSVNRRIAERTHSGCLSEHGLFSFLSVVTIGATGMVCLFMKKHILATASFSDRALHMPELQMG